MFPVRGEAEVPLTVLATGNPPAAPQPSTADTDSLEDQALVEEGSLENEAHVFPKTTTEFVEGNSNLEHLSTRRQQPDNTIRSSVLAGRIQQVGGSILVKILATSRLSLQNTRPSLLR